LKPKTLLETIRCEDGITYHLLYHQQRLDSTLQKLGYSTTYHLSELISPPDEKLYRCRFLYDDEGYKIEYRPYSKNPITSLRIVHNDTINYPFKYADRTNLNTLFEQRGECNDVLIAKNGFITDTTIANIAFLINNQWLTPETPLLEGTTRSRLLDEGKLITASITLSDALKAPRIALLNAMIGFFEMENVIIR
jgi:4-amino-4-deoxychorismate lyase